MLINSLDLGLHVAIVVYLPLSKVLEVGSMGSICRTCEDLISCLSFYPPFIALRLKVIPQLHEKFERCKLTDAQQT